ncbi:GDSL-type esterase/lipase family protein [Pseudonocardia kujensis]|uniref:GDSL-type esterase/lipase family protein n=1 Tax=Pseudonocardia kujensis TaxID=1128675 RepID=UPI001E5198CD|nr:GDSL-type esterase/lipase family protein [Pseudonocardia kujensis]MCE0762215.1 GDSL-type esterase/lipase family protein [Pseudonocardia kujensis]
MPTRLLPVPCRRALPVLALLLAFAATGAGTPALAAGVPPDPRPTAVVALGDSAASGEGTGGYEAGTRGEGGNWCHRSPAAYVHRSALAEVAVDLACSGAGAEHVAFGTAVHHTEGSQAQRLVEVARRHRVLAVTLQVGANDEPDLSGVAVACIRAFLDLREPGCRTTVGPGWADRLAAVAPRIEAAARDVRAAMSEAGYLPDGYAFVLLSYAAPGSETMPAWHGLQGCPYSRPDAGWARTVAFPQLAATIGAVAERVGARFLDLTRLAEGREACTGPLRDEWQRRLTVDPRTLVQGALDTAGRHLFQESFHPTAAAHTAIAGCLREFVGGTAARAACVPGRDGTAHPEGAA